MGSRYENYSRPSNPFIIPLTKYLDRYATETMEYFLVREKLGMAPTADLLVRRGVYAMEGWTGQGLEGFEGG